MEESAALEAGEQNEDEAGTSERDPAEAYGRQVIPQLAKLATRVTGADFRRQATVKYENRNLDATDRNSPAKQNPPISGKGNSR